MKRGRMSCKKNRNKNPRENLPLTFILVLSKQNYIM